MITWRKFNQEFYRFCFSFSFIPFLWFSSLLQFWLLGISCRELCNEMMVLCFVGTYSLVDRFGTSEDLYNCHLERNYRCIDVPICKLSSLPRVQQIHNLSFLYSPILSVWVENQNFHTLLLFPNLIIDENWIYGEKYNFFILDN